MVGDRVGRMADVAALMAEIRTKQRRWLPSLDGRRVSVERAYIDKPANEVTWAENALIIAKEFGKSQLDIHAVLRSHFPHVYGA